MAFVVRDRVKVTSLTSGTGALTLGAAPAGFQDFSVIGDGNTTFYAIVDVGAGAWEVGEGTYTASGATLSRDVVLDSSDSGNLVNFSANSKEVFVTYPAGKSVFFDDTNAISLGGGWTVYEDNGDLVFAAAGVAKARLTASGGMQAAGDIESNETL
jgi:hypothetical protein